MNRGRRSLRTTLTLVASIICLLGLPAASISAPMHHFVYGLEPRLRYEISLGKILILDDSLPDLAGSFHFESQGGTTVHIAVSGRDVDPLTYLPSDPVLRLEGPFPNPVRDRAEIIVTAEAAGAARFRLYDSLAGRVSLDVQTPLQKGRNSVWIEFPPRLGSGIYLLRADLPSETITRKVVFIKH